MTIHGTTTGGYVTLLLITEWMVSIFCVPVLEWTVISRGEGSITWTGAWTWVWIGRGSFDRKCIPPDSIRELNDTIQGRPSRTIGPNSRHRIFIRSYPRKGRFQSRTRRDWTQTRVGIRVRVVVVGIEGRKRWGWTLWEDFGVVGREHAFPPHSGYIKVGSWGGQDLAHPPSIHYLVRHNDFVPGLEG